VIGVGIRGSQPRGWDPIPAPKTIYDVIFDNVRRLQFSRHAVTRYDLWTSRNEMSVIAAKCCLEGLRTE
jgi:hypothetical protein